jgi:hypothetical protein
VSVIPRSEIETAWWGSVGAYRQFDERTVAGQKVTAWMSEEDEDESWDEFLQQIPVGQFHQSSMWARAKASEGWSCIRVLMAGECGLMGGFQLLWRSTRLGRIGYVSKGPVLKPLENRVDADLVERHAISLLKDTARRKRIRALIVQPPDFCNEMSGSLRDADLLPGVQMGVNDATWIVDVSDGWIERSANALTAPSAGICGFGRENDRIWPDFGS